MTEADWNACADPAAMLEALHGTASDRKMRLFACACVRTAWDWLTGPPSRRDVEVAERFADGEADAKEMDRAGRTAFTPLEMHAPRPETAALYEAAECADPDAWAARLAKALGVSIDAIAPDVDLPAPNKPKKKGD